MLNEETTKKPEVISDENLDEVAGGYGLSGSTIGKITAEAERKKAEALLKAREEAAKAKAF